VSLWTYFRPSCATSLPQLPNTSVWYPSLARAACIRRNWVTAMLGIRILWVFTMSLVKFGVMYSILASIFVVFFAFFQCGKQAAQADIHRAQVGDFVNFQLGVQLAARLQDLAGLIGGNGV